MAKEANKTLIGTFVVGAIVLAVIGIIIFGSGKFFQKRIIFVMYFPGSVTGLTVGSPVEFRGVKIGEVTKIAASFNPADLSITIPVYVEFDPKSLVIPGKQRNAFTLGNYQFYKPLLDKGLKAQLKVKSFITGQLYISVEFYPNKPSRLVGFDTGYPEIPTIPSDMEQIMSTLQKIPITDIADRLARAADGIDKAVNSPAIGAGMKNLNHVLVDLNTLIKDLNAEVKPLAKSLRDSSDAARGAFVQAEKTLALKEGVPGEIAAGLIDSTKQAGASLEQMRKTLASYEKIADRNANIGYELDKTLVELDGAARAIRSLADYLERHPESLLKGKPPSQGE